MGKIDLDTYIDDEEFGAVQGKRIHRKNRRLTQREKRVRLQAELIELAEKVPVDVQQAFTPSFLPHGHERAWLINYLEEFYIDNVITDVLGKVRGGKEANVYICAAHPKTGLDLIAAKVYRPRMFRNLRNDAQYRQGRAMLDSKGRLVAGRREALAVQKNTRFGQEIRHGTWLGTEYQTMQLLWDAGADVPKPLAQNDNVILMEFVGEQSAPAPTLNQVTLNAGEAHKVFERLMKNLEIMLACRRVHADLSAYNILYWEGAFKIIDFPQAVDPRRNPDSMELFLRDVERVCQYFARYRIVPDARSLATELWGRYQRAEFVAQEDNLIE